jgi:hypothetical protein
MLRQRIGGNAAGVGVEEVNGSAHRTAPLLAMQRAHNVASHHHRIERPLMPHMLLIVEPLGQREERGVELGKAVYQQMLDFTEDCKRAGVLMASSSLATASSRLRKPEGGAARLIDGPFAEDKEMIGGFFLLNVATRDDALAWAERCPAAGWATVEVRETGPCYT